MPINPITKREQVYPTKADYSELKNFVNLAKTGDEGVKNVKKLSDKYFSFLFALMNAKQGMDRQQLETRLEQVDTLRSDMSEISQNSNPKFSVWLSELIQNARDAKWNDGIGATEISISFNKSEIIFQHNGRPPQYMGFKKNEFNSMLVKGSTKRSDLANEGKFGVGFKFWTFFFENVKLESDNWQIGWDKNNMLGEIEESEFNSGMKLTFTKPHDEYLSKFKQYTKSFDSLYNDDLSRLIEGIAVQKNPISISISLQDKQSIQLIHDVRLRKYSTSKNNLIQYYEIDNKLIMSEDYEFDLYVPSKLIGYDANEFNSEDQIPDIGEITKNLKLEFLKKIKDPFIEQLLKEEFDGEGEGWKSETNLENAAKSHLHSIEALFLIDLSPEKSRHFILYSLFALSEKIDYGVVTIKKKINSRVCYVGKYTVNQERTRLEPSNRNKSIAKVQLASTYSLLNLISNKEFRDEYDILDPMYVDILNSLEIENQDSEFISLSKEEA